MILRSIYFSVHPLEASTHKLRYIWKYIGLSRDSTVDEHKYTHVQTRRVFLLHFLFSFLFFHDYIHSLSITSSGINCVTLTVDVIFIGHGQAINELKTHTVDDGLLFSASKDERFVLYCGNIKFHSPKIQLVRIQLIFPIFSMCLWLYFLSIRLWNVRTCVCVVIFCGEKGHREQVWDNKNSRYVREQRTLKNFMENWTFFNVYWLYSETEVTWKNIRFYL